jgi:hypothetical protein
MWRRRKKRMEYEGERRGWIVEKEKEKDEI